MKILLTIRGDFIAPRFDLAREVLIAACYDHQLLEEPRSIIFSDFSPEKLCDLVLKENAKIVVCGGIEEQHFRFLTWKKIAVFDSVIGPVDEVLSKAVTGTLQAGTILPGVTSCGLIE